MLYTAVFAEATPAKGCWFLDTGYWILPSSQCYAGQGLLDTGCWIHKNSREHIGHWMFDSRCWLLVTGCAFKMMIQKKIESHFKLVQSLRFSSYNVSHMKDTPAYLLRVHRIQNRDQPSTHGLRRAKPSSLCFAAPWEIRGLFLSHQSFYHNVSCMRNTSTYLLRVHCTRKPSPSVWLDCQPLGHSRGHSLLPIHSYRVINALPEKYAFSFFIIKQTLEHKLNLLNIFVVGIIGHSEAP